MNLFLLGRLPNFIRALLFLTSVGFLLGCQIVNTIPISTTPTAEFIISTPSFLTETPIPACVVLSDVELSVKLLSESSFQIRITGLVPHEAVHAILSSKIKGRELETIASGTADENGVFEYSEASAGRENDPEFKDWQIRVVHSRGSTCTEISLP
jgi:hypothetical protein